MAHEAAPEVVPTQLDFAYFYSNPTFSDLTIRIGNEEILAHKIVLSCRSGYFRKILLKKIDLKVVTLEDVTCSHFKKLLKIIYSGILELNLENSLVLDHLITLADRFRVKFVEKELVENFYKMLTIENCCYILNSVIPTKFEKPLKRKLLEFMNKNATQIIEADHFIKLSQCAAASFLSQDELYLEETKILEAIEKWRKHNKDPDDLVAKCLRLSRFTKTDLLTSVGHCDFVDKIRLLQVLAEMETKTFKVQTRYEDDNGIKKFWNQNIATEELGTKVMHRERQYTRQLFTLPYRSYKILDNPDDITVELGCLYAFNHIKFSLNNDNLNYSYYIEISENNQNWKRIIDYTQFYCNSTQNLYFEQISAKYIRVVGLINKLRMASVEIMLKSETPQFENGLIRPTENVATVVKGAKVDALYQKDKLLNGDIQPIQDNWTGHVMYQGFILIQLPQPFLLSSCKLLLFGNYQYQYFIETSTNNKDWEIVVDRRNVSCSGWQNLQFSERPVVFIRIRGTFSSEYSNRFKCVHFESPSL